MLSKLSFRQLLLGVFLLIAVLLSAASLHALWTLDRLAAHSRDSGRHALALTENTQQLAERSVAMTRSARQYLVLDDPAFRKRYADAWRDALTSLDAVAAALPYTPPELFARWRQAGEHAWDILQQPSPRPANGRSARQQALERMLAPLPEVSQQLADEVKREVDRRNGELLAELDQRRAVLKAQVIASVILAALLAGGFGLWLSRPLEQIEQAIDTLGESRYDQAIAVRGPKDLQRVGQQLNWLRQRLADLEADKARFLRHISHELKTPLAALREGVALLEDGVAGALSPDQREIAGILNQNTAALQSQIEALLRYNAAAFDAQHLQRQPVDMEQVLAQAIDSQRLQWQAARLTVVSEGKAEPIAADSDKLATVVGNLLSNAVRFSPADGLISFRLGQLHGKLLLECADQGPGVAPEDAARIFEPFYQGQRQPPGARRGNGIGLSIVQEYVTAHGGVLKLLPSDRGANFRIELPYER
ncbi:two-component sensor histidine kinase [Pseudoduganella sp. FT55W]|uniref:Signal transduction histidine-protein kinase/phosphatase MprB n=1 Tax=Duganella rivi TaxID=2666083 RepID=A0A7X4GMP0_9BURK|nr:HAMP domain-containing sensor histidine kinase [Duganella rivi]MYM66213.1 two-component sensor histidine kinase [Duganella rivi]